jgi:hypothetical protein
VTLVQYPLEICSNLIACARAGHHHQLDHD